MDNTYLAHYGVKGQKHGERRYQNKDGSLTAEGRVHYGIGKARGKVEKVTATTSAKVKSAGEVIGRVVGKAANSAGSAFKSVPITGAQRRAAKVKRLEEKKARIEADAENRRKIKEYQKGIKDAKKDLARAKRGDKKKISEMSDQELRDRMTRVQNEMKLRTAELDNKHPAVSAGKNFIAKNAGAFAEMAIRGAAEGAGKALGVKALSIGREALGLTDDQVEEFYKLTKKK